MEPNTYKCLPASKICRPLIHRWADRAHNDYNNPFTHALANTKLSLRHMFQWISHLILVPLPLNHMIS